MALVLLCAGSVRAFYPIILLIVSTSVGCASTQYVSADRVARLAQHRQAENVVFEDGTPAESEDRLVPNSAAPGATASTVAVRSVTTRSRGRGALYGALAGTALGVVGGVISGSQAEDYCGDYDLDGDCFLDSNDRMAMRGVGLGLVGGALGAALGAIIGVKTEYIAVEHRPTFLFAPSQGGGHVGMKLKF